MNESELRKPELPKKGVPTPESVAAAAVPVVPPRNNVVAKPVFKKGTPADIQGERDPNYEYQWVEGRDTNHPSYVDKYLNPRYVGDPEIGYAKMEAWEIASSKQERFSGNVRDDQGKPVDTTVWNGSMILIRTPKENASIAREYDLQRQEATARRLGHNESDKARVDDAQSGGYAQFKTTSIETGRGR